MATIHCPHCRVAFVREWQTLSLVLGVPDADGVTRQILHTACVSCSRHIITLVEISYPQLGAALGGASSLAGPITTERLIHPRSVERPPLPATVPQPIASDYTEAATILTDSPRGSAALSRRCLQNLLVAKAGVTKRDLVDQIKEVLDAGILPRIIAEDLDAVRAIGNFGAHPIKSKSTGEIVEVEPGEAEWNLDVLDALFEFFYVQAEKRQERRDTLNAKLKDAGKPPLR